MSVQGQRVAVVTGASQGIGAGLVEGYRKLGYAVVATSRNIGPSTDPGVVAVPGDIAERDTAERVIATAVERFGRVDTLVNNAGIFVAKPFTEYTEEDYRAVLNVNLDGFFRITQLAVERMLQQGGGHVVQISSSLGDQADAKVTSVLASLTKGGLQAATRALAIEYAKQGIRANAVALGTIKTPMHPVETHEALAGLHPVGHMGEIDDIVEAVLYLERAPFVTGVTLPVDGGQSAGR
ncbi:MULTISPECIES: SDR family oxidoreductase [unclassified Streptomyces]|uniref:SDR family NAD(P)-dependent oxidoreductase n=1 Tax=unclassified Streptomyces TaxID=2593676 RepID=UPI00037C5DB3|nr:MULTISPECIES: SDR family oxidoreductase [unclassified Streptomyces]MYX39170.1 SDR family oxidoreductase [Streptomyces sp. SID8377]